MTSRKICVVTGSRADYGLLYWVMKSIQADSDLLLQVAVTGMHLSADFGLTARTVEADGFPISARIDSLLPGDSAAAVAKSIGRGVIGFADAFEQLEPDLVLLLGDRFEILAAAQAALVAKIPVAHIAGGDVTEGAFDDAIRHSITKMSHLHFVTNAAAESRVRQLGEDPRFIFNFGSPGLDTLVRTPLLPRPELEATLGFSLRPHNLLVTFHPATLDAAGSAAQLTELFHALDSLGPDFGVIFTKGNADTEGLTLNRLIGAYVETRPNCRLFDSLGQQKYLSVMKQVDALVGNSSSGLYEAPSLRKPAVNIGDRQKGRLRAASVIDCAPDAGAIERAIRDALVLDCSAVKNPYGDGNSAPRIVAVLKSIEDPRRLVRKEFVDA
jgi:UDP-N-acetylglucosamine 2-epimerase (non-hydrolysing)/GDP/UDP-N,N'-diacetylbacillosamine 2-epimerase (hydrolysing)